MSERPSTNSPAKMPMTQDNPYASPRAPAAKTDKRPERQTHRLILALLLSFEAWLGASLTALLVWQVLAQAGLVFDGALPIIFGLLSLVTAPVGVAMSIWVWREPKSKWPSLVANTMGVAPFFLAVLCVLIGLF